MKFKLNPTEDGFELEMDAEGKKLLETRVKGLLRAAGCKKPTKEQIESGIIILVQETLDQEIMNSIPDFAKTAKMKQKNEE